MKYWLVSVCIGWLCCSVAPEAHDFHISKGTVEYVQQAQSLQVTLHVFIDDLEQALEAQGAPKLFLGTEKEAAEADEYVSKYLAKHFNLQADGKAVKFVYLGKEISDDLSALWFYLEARPVGKPQKIQVKYDLLTEVFDDQKNILNFRGPANARFTLLFERGDTDEEIELGR